MRDILAARVGWTVAVAPVSWVGHWSFIHPPRAIIYMIVSLCVAEPRLSGADCWMSAAVLRSHESLSSRVASSRRPRRSRRYRRA